MDVRNLVSKHTLSKPVMTALIDLINELYYSWEMEASGILDIQDTDTMPDQFALDWLTFYGVTVRSNERLDRSALRRYRAVLRKRGEIAAIKYMLQSGGGLFLSTPIMVEVYPWYDCPPSVNADPKDGVIYVKTSDRRITVQSDMVAKVTPAGYKYDLLFFYETSKVDARVVVKQMQMFQHQERDTGASVTTGTQRDKRTERAVRFLAATFNPSWFIGGAFKDGYTIADLMRVPEERYMNIIKTDARRFDVGVKVPLVLSSVDNETGG